MKYLRILVFIIPTVMWSQNLNKHLWQNRIITITANKANSAKAISQLNALKIDTNKLIERKLIIYLCIDKDCKFYDFKNEIKLVKAKKTSENFRVSLIGLDGGVKFRSNKIEKANVFFNLIDKMPMRQQELKN